MYAKSFKVPALARAQTYGISHNKGADTKLSMIQYMYTNTCEYMYVYKEVLSVRTRKGTNIRKFAPHRFIHKRIDDRKKKYTSKNIHVYKAVQSVNTRKGKSICEFAKHRFIYNRIYDVTYVYL